MQGHFDELFAVTAPGLEDACAGEIATLLACATSVEKGGVRFSGSLEDLYRVNLWSRLASRVLVRLDTVKAKDFPDLFRKVRRLPWGRFVRVDRAVAVRSSSRRSRLNHTDRISRTVVEAINGALGRADLPAEEGAQQVLVRVEDDLCQISIDSSGDLLYRRGYRTEVSRAPLRETLAAGILHLLDWHGQIPLYDPMCGSGTFILEGALMAANIAPGLNRDFAFQQWPRNRSGLWHHLVDAARRQTVDVPVPLGGSDADPGVIASARRNAERCSCAEAVRFSVRNIGEVTAPAPAGLILCNPPYGIRLGAESELAGLYRDIGALYKKSFKGWRGALFCPSEKLVAETGLDFKVRKQLRNGGVATKLFVCEM